jgi:hypothetical protein
MGERSIPPRLLDWHGLHVHVVEVGIIVGVWLLQLETADAVSHDDSHVMDHRPHHHNSNPLKYNNDHDGSSYMQKDRPFSPLLQPPPLLLLFQQAFNSNTTTNACSWLAWMGLKLFFVLLLLGMILGTDGGRSKRSNDAPPLDPHQEQNGPTNKTPPGNDDKTRATTLSLSSSSSYYLSSRMTVLVSWHGWSHRAAGAAHLIWLCVGTFGLLSSTTATTTTTTTSSSTTTTHWHSFQYNERHVLYYDVILGLLGMLATWTAARDFPHRYVKNAQGQSGTLHSHAMVTHAEMMEHFFYQGLNLGQALYLHAMAAVAVVSPDTTELFDNYGYPALEAMVLLPLGLLWMVTAPWLIRHQLPVHSFSNNWKIYQAQKLLDQQQQQQQGQQPQDNKTKGHQQDDTIEIVLYRIKKAQYLFYKHVILHGINISVALETISNATTTMTTTAAAAVTTRYMIPYSFSWRVFWLLLNTSYVMEFFLQTLVKRHVLSQRIMLWLQRWLMMAASLGAISVLFQQEPPQPQRYQQALGYPYGEPGGTVVVRWWICLFSLVLNFVHRHHDVVNTMVIAVVGVVKERGDWWCCCLMIMTMMVYATCG